MQLSGRASRALPWRPALAQGRFIAAAPREAAVFPAGDSRLRRDGGSAILRGDAPVMVAVYKDEDRGVDRLGVVCCTWRN